MTLADGEARDIGWEATVPVNTNALRWEVAASEITASGKAVADRLKVSQQVIAAIPVRTFQATLTQLERPLDMAVKSPPEAGAQRRGGGGGWAPQPARPPPRRLAYMGADGHTRL